MGSKSGHTNSAVVKLVLKPSLTSCAPHFLFFWKSVLLTLHICFEMILCFFNNSTMIKGLNKKIF